MNMAAATFYGNKRKIEPKETTSYLIPRLLVVFTLQLEILVTTLGQVKNGIHYPDTNIHQPWGIGHNYPPFDHMTYTQAPSSV